VRNLRLGAITPGSGYLFRRLRLGAEATRGQRRHILLALATTMGNVERAAARLAIPRSALNMKIKAKQIPLPRKTPTS
jgi:DNA-binding NtrC family response regulator